MRYRTAHSEPVVSEGAIPDRDDRRRRWIIYGGTGAFVAAITFATVGFPPLLFVAGVWAFAALTNHWVDALAGPTAWLAGLVIEATILTGESALLALVIPHAHPQWVYVVVLLLPIVAAMMVHRQLAERLPARSSASTDRMSGEPLLAVMCVVLIEIMFEAIKLHGHDFGLTWFMTGDARNQVVGTRQIVAAGGVTLKQMTTYPALVNAICALFDGAGGRSDLTAAALMVRDVQAMVATVVLICTGVALCFVAAVCETFTRADGHLRRLPIYLVLPLGACGSISIGALFLGLGSSGGFLSAMGCLVFALSSLVLGMRIVKEYHNVTLLVIVCAMFLVVGSWTFVVVIPALALVVGCVRGVRGRLADRGAPTTREGRVTMAVVVFSLLNLVGIFAALLFKGATLVAQLKSPGGIVAGNPRIFYWLGLTILAAVAVAPNSRERKVRLLVLGEFVVLAMLVAWMHTIHPTGVAWSYYATKMLWLATCAVAWVPFVLVADALRKIDQWVRRTGARALAQLCIALAGSSGVLWGISHETPYPFPWHWAFIGSTFPTPMMIQKVVDESNAGTPFVFWQYSVPADDKLGDFWSALTWDYTSGGALRPSTSRVVFPYWASGESGSLPELCQIVSDYRLRIVTKNPALIPTLLSSCKGYQPIPSQAHER